MDLEDAVLSEISHGRDKQNKVKIDADRGKDGWLPEGRRGRGWWAQGEAGEGD